MRMKRMIPCPTSYEISLMSVRQSYARNLDDARESFVAAPVSRRIRRVNQTCCPPYAGMRANRFCWTRRSFVLVLACRDCSAGTAGQILTRGRWEIGTDLRMLG
nr:hypothetical protein CFP56_21255 [Quercus suber]